MYHSITFRPPDDPFVDYNTWDTFHLIPTKRPHMGPPEIEFPYSNELLYEPIHLDDKINSPVYYKSRSASWEFAVENGHDWWASVYSGLLEKLHGKIFEITLEDDPDYYYIGRVSIKDWDSQPSYSVVTIEALCEPYKYSANTVINLSNMGGQAKSWTTEDTFYETPAIVVINNYEAIDSLRISGLFTDRITGKRDSYMIMDNVRANYAYTINGENKTITYSPFDSSLVFNNMNNVSKFPGFPTILHGSNRLRLYGTPNYSTISMANCVITYTPRTM